MAKPTPTLRSVLTKAMPKPRQVAPTRFNQAGKPDPAGLYDKDGYMTQVPGKANSFTKQSAAPETPYVSPEDKLRFENQLRIVAERNRSLKKGSKR